MVSDPSLNKIKEMVEFIISSDLNLIKQEHVDVSDVSLYVDEIFSFTFGNEEDATLFQLRFVGSNG